MPHSKNGPEQLWKQWDRKAQKTGFHKTVYSVNGDEYTGDWLNNKRSGKGTYMWKTTSEVYDGDWKNGKRYGFGTLSVPSANTSINGLFGIELRKLYSGGWKNDKRHGFGTQYYNENEHYEGEWYADKRSGWGRMYFADGSAYEGEWFDDQRNGTGMLRLANGNRYEGTWKDDCKNGTGKFYYLDKGQVYEGFWVNNVAKCGKMVDFDRDHAPDATEFQLKSIKLKDADKVLSDAVQYFQTIDD